MFDRGLYRSLLLSINIIDQIASYCNVIHRDPVFKNLLLQTEENFDFIIVEGYWNECVLPLIGVHKVPFAYITSAAACNFHFDAIDSPQAYDHFPLPAAGYFKDDMNLIQRTFNGLLNFFGLLTRHGIILSSVDRAASQLLSNQVNLTLSAKEIENQFLSLLIAKATPGIMYGSPKSANFIEAGGIHCVPSQPLPNDLECFIDDSGDAGFIIVSFGSLLRGSNMPNELKKVFIKTFARIHQKVLWKWEGGDGDLDMQVPSTVKLMSWMPQQDLLGHPKARLFITHAGLSSIEEAVYHGVPLIALPVFADQPVNAGKIHKDGYGIRLEWDNLSEDILYDAIQEILTNPK